MQKPALSRNVDLCGAFCRILKLFLVIYGVESRIRAPFIVLGVHTHSS